MTTTTLLMNLGVVLGLLFLAQTFTGLNLGLFARDCGQLQVLIDVPSQNANADKEAIAEAKYARTVLPLRRQGNLLLCTILLSNTMVNAAMAMFLATLAG